MTDISQDTVTAGIAGALERLSASHLAVKAAAAKVYTEGAAPPTAQTSGNVAGQQAGPR